MELLAVLWAVENGDAAAFDPTLPLLQSLAAAGLVAGVVMLALGLPWRSPSPARVALGWSLGVSLGLFAGCWLHPDLRPDWPPREDLDRFLLILLPATLVVEALAAWPRVPNWTAWLLRLVIAFAAARLLLHGSVYLEDSGEWTGVERWSWLAGLGGSLFAVWGLLALLDWRRPGPSLPLALAVVCAASGVAVMLSGYATGGQLGLPLAAALVGAVLASLLLARPAGLNVAPGVGVVGLFSLLVIGRFFGELTTTRAVLLFFAPLVCWLPELPWRRGPVRVALVAFLTGLVVFLAQQRFDVESKRATPTAEDGLEDYMNFGK